MHLALHCSVIVIFCGGTKTQKTTNDHIQPLYYLRRMPYIVPEDIIPWLMTRKLWPSIPERKIKSYWNHLRDVGSDIAGASPSGAHHPLWIWGDAANYSKDQNIIVICFGSVLDDEKDSVKKCFPLMLLREES